MNKGKLDASSFQEAPIPKNEKKRLQVLRKLNILDTPTEERFDRITRVALSLFNVPISTITLIDSQREWFKSYQGLSNREGKRAISFCGHAMLADDLFIVPDTKKDPRFSGNPMVIGKPFIRFYAAVPIKAATGERMGVFCIKDYKPGNLDLKQQDLLKALGAWAELELNSHELSRALEARRTAEAKITQLNEILRLLNKILRHDLLNNLTVIKNGTQLILQGNNRESLVKNVSSAIEQSLSLISRIDELESSVSTGEALKAYDVKNVINEVIQNFPSIKFRVKGKARVLADEAIFSVVQNIIRNASLHGKTSAMDIKINPKKDFVEVSLADYGRGIKDKIKEYIFKEGFKHGSTGQSGLGLYIVKKTVERYGGEVFVRDRKPKGVVFILKLKALA